MMWFRSHHFDRTGARLADDHYSRKTVGSPQFMPPGRKLVLVLDAGVGRSAVFGVSWPYPELVAHAWPNAWICTIFRREPGCPYLASDLIVQAVAATRWKFGEPPKLGMVTWIQPKKVRPTMVHGRRVWGWTFLRAGFEPDHPTRGGHLTFRLPPARMPPPCRPQTAQLALPFLQDLLP